MGRLQFKVSPAGCCASAMVARTRLSMCQEQGLRMLPQGSQLTQHSPQPQWTVRLALRASGRRLAPLRRAAAGLPMLQLGPPASASRGASSRGRSQPSDRATGALAPGGARGQEGEVRTAEQWHGCKSHHCLLEPPLPAVRLLLALGGGCQLCVQPVLRQDKTWCGASHLKLVLQVVTLLRMLSQLPLGWHQQLPPLVAP